MNNKKTIVLASGSPRREELLVQIFDDFEIVPARLNEPSPCWQTSRAPELWVESLAYLKAAEVAQAYPSAVIIAADTVCVHNGKIIGKPADIDDARNILTNHFAGPNYVITGLAVLAPAGNIKIIDHAVTELDMRAMTDIELEEYLDSGIWQGKAGAYAYQSGGDKFVKQIKGSESNVVGLPMELLTDILQSLGILNWLRDAE